MTIDRLIENLPDLNDAPHDYTGFSGYGLAVNVAEDGMEFVEFEAGGAVAAHEGTYNHANYDTAYGWGDHAGLYELDGSIATHAALPDVHHVAFVEADADALYTLLPVLIAPVAIYFGTEGTPINQEYDIDGITWVTSTDGTPNVVGHLTADCLVAMADAHDGEYFAVREDNGVASEEEPLTAQFNFTGVTTFAQVILRGQYAGSTSHFLYVELWNDGAAAWDAIASIPNEAALTIHELSILNPALYITAGVVKLRLRHIQNGVTSHRYLFEYLVLSTGMGGGGGGVQTAIQTPSSATGDVAATNVQAAIAELASEKQVQGDVLDDLNTLGAVTADSEFLVGTGAGVFAWESGATARTSMGVYSTTESDGLITTHESTYNHANFATAYGWGDHAGLYIAVAFVDNKGDIISASADDTPLILAIGGDGTVLTADSGEATGLKWTAAGSGTVDTSGVPVANDFARFTDLDTIEGLSYAETLAALSGQATAAFDWNNQNFTSVGAVSCGAIGCGTITSASGYISAQGGDIYIGVDKDVGGTLHLYGEDAGGSNPQGGIANFYSSSTHEGAVDKWIIQNSAGDLQFLSDATRIMTLVDADSSLEFHTRAFTNVGAVGCGAITSTGDSQFDDVDVVNDLNVEGQLSLGSETELTIVGGAITVTKSYHQVDTDGTSPEDLDTINGGVDGQILVLKQVANTRDVVIKSGTGNIWNRNGDITFVNNLSNVTMIYDAGWAGGAWLVLSYQA